MTELPKRLQTLLSSLEALIKQKVNSQGAVSVVDVFATLIFVANNFVLAALLPKLKEYHSIDGEAKLFSKLIVSVL